MNFGIYERQSLLRLQRCDSIPTKLSKNKRLIIGVARGGKGAMPPNIFRKYSHFLL